MSGRDRIIITGAFRFPDGDAAAARVLGLGKALRAGGFRVEFAGWEARGGDGPLEHQGFRYTSQDEFRSQRLSPPRRVLRFLSMGSNTLRWLAAQDLSEVRAVISYHPPSAFSARLIRLCAAAGVQVIFDSTEWYDRSHLPGGRFGLAAMDSELRMRVINRRIGKGIVISALLRDYYTARGCSVLRVPPLVDFGDPKWSLPASAPSGDGVRLVYAGVPAKKDLLANAIRALTRVEGVTLELLGPDRAAVAACLEGDVGLLDALGERIILRGKVAQADVPARVAAADFSVLLRPDARYANAGFPTKVVESLAAGVPVIANRTSDISEYVRDGLEGLLVTGARPEQFAQGLRRALSLTAAQRGQMRGLARRRAEECFDYRGYVEALRAFVVG